VAAIALAVLATPSPSTATPAAQTPAATAAPAKDAPAKDNPVAAAPADLGMKADRLNAAAQLFREAVDRNELHGAVLYVARRGTVVMHEAIGWRDRTGQRPMTTDTVFHVASNTKPIVAAAALRLAEQGRLDLDADVGKYLPEFSRDAYRGVTVRRLLSHTSGLRIPTVFLEPLAKAGDPGLPEGGPTLRSETARFAAIAPEAAPGATYAYNNPGYNIVGAVLEAITGQRIEPLLQDIFYKPLGMVDSVHSDRPGIVERRAVVETRKDGVWTRTYQPGDPPKYPFVRSAGGLLTTATDYARFLQMFLDEGRVGGTRLLSSAAVRTATAAHTRTLFAPAAAANQKSFYGLGWQVFPDGRYGHGGADGTFAWVDPQRELVAIAFTQSPGGKLPFDDFQRLVAEACPAESPIVAGVVGHRGLPRELPENTLIAFNACLERRLGFELDVRRSQDGQLVCVHDETLDRTTDGTGPVAGKTLAELQSLDARRGGPADPVPLRLAGGTPRIPTLDEVFAAMARYDAERPVVAVDLKGDDPRIEADVVKLAQQHGVLPRLVIIGRAISSAEVRKRLRAAAAAAPAACLAERPEDFAAALADGDSSWVYLRYVPERADVERAKAAGKRVFVAGVKFATAQPENWRRAAVRGVDAILTDDVVELAAQLREDRYRLQERRESLLPYTEPPAEFATDFGPYRSPRAFSDGSVADTPELWQKRRREILDDWRKLLGGDSPEPLPQPTIKTVAREAREDFEQQRVEVEVLPGGKFAPGHLLIPRGPGPFPAAVVLFYESATSVGLADRGRGTHDYGLQLARRGFVTLSIGTPGSLEFPAAKTGDLLANAGAVQDRQPLAILAYAAASCHTALANHPAVDPARIGVIGLSYGGKWSMFASCLHEQFACAVWSDPGIVFNEQNGNVNYWEPWYLGYERGVKRPAGVPNADRPRTGLYRRLHDAGRDLHELHALMAPRPVLVSGGTEDPPRNWRALNRLREINKLLGADSLTVAMTKRPTHVPTPETLELELRFLEYHLKYR
jgi:CubicO group peptidase (beta-lactamase class C family)/dienelactone hydrolase